MAPTDGIKSEFYFNSSPELKNQYGTYENYRTKMMAELKSTPLWSQGKAWYEVSTEKYNYYMSLFSKLKTKLDKAQSDYDTSLATYMKKNNITNSSHVASGVKSSLKSDADLTAELIHNTNETETLADIELGHRFAAVDMQRHGLYFNG